MNFPSRSLLVSSLLIIALTVPVVAIEPMSLPNIQLATSSGDPVSGTQVWKTSNWLLVYIRPDSKADKDLLTSLTGKNQLPMSAVVVVVAGVNAEKIKDIAAAYPDWASATWLADTNSQLATQLKLTGSPIILALHDSKIAWSLNGKPFDAQKTKSALTDWISASDKTAPPK